MEKTYSVVFYSKDIVPAVKKMKDDLKSLVKDNWYNSCNSEAHITICEFKIDDSQIESIKKKLLKLGDTFSPFTVYLDSFGAFEAAGAFYIAPNKDSADHLKPIMRKIHESLKSLKLKKSDIPHMSIGRRLTSENLQIANKLFTTVHLEFECNQIVLRELEPHRQFFVIDTFPFGSNPEPEFVQGSLF